MPSGPRQTREDTRGRLYRLARPASTPDTDTSDTSLPGPAQPTYNETPNCLDTKRRHPEKLLHDGDDDEL
jgi:hypothetical protein